MVYVSCIVTLLLSAVVFADYDIDNADTSVVYSMPATGRSWMTITMGTPWDISFSNSTGNYTIVLDSSNCYDQNYASAQGGCSTGDGCFIQLPFAGSGITMYVFNAGFSGMTASFSVDGGPAASGSIGAPTAAENYQVSNVSLYNVQGLPSGNHTIKMTLMDWEGGVTFMKFDYAHVNETFVARAVPSSTTASSTPTTASTAPPSSQTPTASNRIDVGGIVGITLGVAAMLGLGGIVICVLWLRKRKRRAPHRRSSSSTPESTFRIEPLPSEYLRSPTPSSRPHAYGSSSFTLLRSGENPAVPPLMPFPRDTHATGRFPPSNPIQNQKRPITSGAIASVLRPLPQYSPDNDPFVSSSLSMSTFRVADEGSLAFSESAIASRYNLNPAQVETVRGLVADRVPADTIARIIEAFVSSGFSTDEANADQDIPSSAYSLDPPPSYTTGVR